MFIQYEKTTRKITGFQSFPADKNLMPEGIDDESQVEYVVKNLTDPAKADEVKQFFADEVACMYATNGHIVPYVEETSA